MVCSIAIVAAALLGATAVTPDLIESLTAKLDDVVSDLRVIQDSESVVSWEGNWRNRGRDKDAIPVAVYLFKAQRRLRIHVLSDVVAPEQVDMITTAIADASGASIVSRSYAASATGNGVIDPEPPAASGSAANGKARRSPALPARVEPTSAHKR